MTQVTHVEHHFLTQLATVGREAIDQHHGHFRSNRIAFPRTATP